MARHCYVGQAGKALFLVVLFISASIGCRKVEIGEAPLTPSLDPAAVWVNDTRTLKDGSAIVRKPDGTIINRSGWNLPISLPDKKRWHATTVVIEGQLVEVLNTPFFPETKLMMKFPRHSADGDAEYKVTQILEFTSKAKKPYCYQFFGEEDREVYSGVTTYFSYRDDDGDGTFETLGASCSVPGWVK